MHHAVTFKMFQHLNVGKQNMKTGNVQIHISWPQFQLLQEIANAEIKTIPVISSEFYSADSIQNTTPRRGRVSQGKSAVDICCLCIFITNA